MSERVQVAQSVEAQAAKVRQLKADKAEKAEIEKEVATLLELKKVLASFEKEATPNDDKKKAKPAKTSFTLKTAKVRANKSDIHWYEMTDFKHTNRVQKIILTRIWPFVKRSSRQLPTFLRNTVLSLLIHLFLNSRLEGEREGIDFVPFFDTLIL